MDFSVQQSTICPTNLSERKTALNKEKRQFTQIILTTEDGLFLGESLVVMSNVLGIGRRSCSQSFLHNSILPNTVLAVLLQTV